MSIQNRIDGIILLFAIPVTASCSGMPSYIPDSGLEVELEPTSFGRVARHSGSCYTGSSITPATPHESPHWFRHTHATNLHDAGVDLRIIKAYLSRKRNFCRFWFSPRPEPFLSANQFWITEPPPTAHPAISNALVPIHYTLIGGLYRCTSPACSCSALGLHRRLHIPGTDRS